MGCICGRLKRKKGKPVSLHLGEKEIIVWPERVLDRAERAPELPPRTYRPPPMSYCGRWVTQNMKLIAIFTNTTFAVLVPEMRDASLVDGCHFVVSPSIHGLLVADPILNDMN